MLHEFNLILMKDLEQCFVYWVRVLSHVLHPLLKMHKENWRSQTKRSAVWEHLSDYLINGIVRTIKESRQQNLELLRNAL